jgi:hypothetical protein
MAERVAIDLICEDSGHERLLAPLLRRIVQSQGFVPQLRVVSARGGAPSVKAAVEVWSRQVARGNRPMPDMLVVGHDANCHGYQARTDDILGWSPRYRDMVVAACPNAHIERWYLADQDAFLRVVGGNGRIAVPEKCERGLYKALLKKAVLDAGQIAVEGGLEFGHDIAQEIDPTQLERVDPSFRAFYRSMLSRLHQLHP